MKEGGGGGGGWVVLLALRAFLPFLIFLLLPLIRGRARSMFTLDLLSAFLSRSVSFQKKDRHYFDALESTSISGTDMLPLNYLLTCVILRTHVLSYAWIISDKQLTCSISFSQ